MNGNPAMPQYVMSMSTNINLGIIDDNMHQQQMRMNPAVNSIKLKSSIASRGAFRKNKRGKKNMGVKDYMKQMQDSQTFSRIDRGKVQESINNMRMFSPSKDAPEQQFEYKALDSQIGSLMKRDYTVDRSNMRNQNLASLVVSSGKQDSTISPGPRALRLNDNLMFKSTNAPSNLMQGMVYGAHNTINSFAETRRIASPVKDGRRVELEPIEPKTIKNIHAKIGEISSPLDKKLEETKSPLRHKNVLRQETEINNNILDKVEQSNKRDSSATNDVSKKGASPPQATGKISREKR